MIFVGFLFIAAGGVAVASVFLSKAMAYAGGKFVGLIDLVDVDGIPVEEVTAQQFLLMRAAAQLAGIQLKLNSGFRSMAQQTALYAKHLAGTGNTAAKPGHSNHQNGRALDIATGGWESPTFRWLAANAHRYGFTNDEGKRVNEPWHWVRTA